MKLRMLCLTLVLSPAMLSARVSDKPTCCQTKAPCCSETCCKASDNCCKAVPKQPCARPCVDEKTPKAPGKEHPKK